MATKPLSGLTITKVKVVSKIPFQIFLRQACCFPIQRSDYASESQSVMRTGLQHAAIVETSYALVADL